jgi:hypothetical protein
MWQAMLGLGVALIGFLGVVIGAVVTGYVTLRQARLATEREREAQQRFREQQRKDAHDAFKRDAILALHDAATAYWELAVDAYSLYGTTRPEQGALRSVVQPLNTAYSRLTVARAKVFDDELRQLTKALEKQCDLALEQVFEALDAGHNLLGAIEGRVNALLRSLV